MVASQRGQVLPSPGAQSLQEACWNSSCNIKHLCFLACPGTWANTVTRRPQRPPMPRAPAPTVWQRSSCRSVSGLFTSPSPAGTRCPQARAHFRATRRIFHSSFKELPENPNNYFKTAASPQLWGQRQGEGQGWRTSGLQKEAADGPGAGQGPCCILACPIHVSQGL